MEDSDVDRQGVESAIQLLERAVYRFALERSAALARKAMVRLQRVQASGIFGDDYRYRTVWDEYCHEIQQGPHGLLEWAWESTVGPIIRGIVDELPPEETVLLSMALADDIGGERFFRASPDAICESIRERLAAVAGARDLSRFDPAGY